jgi:CubicO group peptidase (beta-lactamase class C family)
MPLMPAFDPAQLLAFVCRSALVLLCVLCWPATATLAAEARTPAPRPDNAELRGAFALLDRWLDAHRAYQAIPGLSVGVVHDQELVWQRSYGYANPRREVRATAETLYSICSISKVFTGIGILQLRDAGVLELDDPVAEHLDWFRIDQSHPGSGPITVRALLTHASGLPRESIGPYWSPPDFPFPDRKALIETLPLQETLYPADTYFQYSNLGFALAGEIIATKSDQDYARYVEKRILAPLELESTRPGFPKRLMGSAVAIGHGARDRNGTRPVIPEFDAAAITPAVGYTSNVVDLARFAAWNFRTRAGKNNRVLAPATLREMQRVQWIDPDWQNTRGLGFETRRSGQDTVVGHDGTCPGYSSALALFPAHALGVIVLANASGIDTATIVGNVQRLVVPALAAAAAPTAKLPDFGRYTGRYDAQPWRGEVAVVQHGVELRVAWLPSDDVTEGLIRLRQVDKDTFQRIRGDGELPGERWTFERDEASGDVVALSTHALRLTKLR